MPPTLAQLRYRHPEHRAKCDHWHLLDAIVAGGHKMTETAKRKLLTNPDGRPEAVIAERVKLATYTNKIGPILSRFNSQLFSKKPTFAGSKDPFWEDRFFSSGALLDDDDDARASFVSFLARSMLCGLTNGKAIAQVDTRLASGQSISRQDQKINGELEPYVVLHPRSALWDWQPGKDGFVFAKLHVFRLKRDRWDQDPIPEHDFTIYQRNDNGIITASRYVVRKQPKEGEKIKPEMLDLDNLSEDEVTIETIKLPNGQALENLPIFSVNGVFEFPILTLTLPDELCIADQLFEPQKAYFTQTAALEYALYTNNYSMPVINGVDEDDDDPFQGKKFGDGYYLALKTGQTISAFERGGSTIATAISYRNEIKRDIYDQLQQVAMSAADGVAIIARSGESKREDRRPEQLLLERYGQMVKEYAIQILRVASIAHAELEQWKIEGFDDFMGEGVLEEIADLQGLSVIPMPSPTFKREAAKHLARRAGKRFAFPDQQIKQVIDELDAADGSDFEPQPPIENPSV